MKLSACFVSLCFLATMVCTALAQTAPSSSVTSTQVPRLIKFSGIAKDESGKPMSGAVGITFLLYKDQQGGSPLWVETQNVQADVTGHYTAMLGSASSDGVPLSLFSSAEVHWVSTQIAGQPEQPRMLLLSVPYALKAADAETLGGLPASAFIHASTSGGPASAGSKAGSAATGTVPPAGVTGTGTKNFIPIWTGATTLGNSVIYETGGNVGVGTKTPKAKVDVAGASALGIQATVPGAQAAIAGIATATSGGTTGTYGQSSDPKGNGVFGLNKAATGGIGTIGVSQATSGSSYGVYGQSSSPSGNGVYGINSATTGYASGVNGTTNSPSGPGVNGYNAATTGNGSGVIGGTASPSGIGVQGFVAAPNGYGVIGVNTATTGYAPGVSGTTNSAAGPGINGYNAATSGGSGVIGGSASPSGVGVQGFVAAPNGYGVIGNNTATSGFANGVLGISASPTGTAVNGNATSTSGNPNGVYGSTHSPNGVGVAGESTAASGGYGISGQTESTDGTGTAGVFTAHGGTGLILAALSGSSYKREFTVDAAGNGFFAGNLNVTGTLTKGGGSFKIDHPLDPANKYLSHSFVESPDMMNVYNGNVTTDRHGLATVELPGYFEALNGDFRYQLTVIGKFAQAIVAKKIASNRFVIRTSKPGVEVSWQVTGIRHDAYANAYRIPVEEDKSSLEQGYYLHPEVFGQPDSKGISAAHKAVPVSQEVLADASRN